MILSQILYILAYCIFLIGAAKSFRENGSKTGVWIMGGGVLLDFLMSVLPMMGVKALSSGIRGTNAVIIFAIIFGFIVWMLFLVALVAWRKRKLPLFHSLITAVEVCWFIDFISFLYGMYKFPLK
jgi:hypothetical protein